MFWYRRGQYFGLRSVWGTLYLWKYINIESKTDCLVQNGTVCVTNCVTEQVQTALQTVLQNRYRLHYKLCHTTVTVCITNCATEQAQSALQTVLQDRYSLHYKLCYRTGTFYITWSSAFWLHVGQERSSAWSLSWCSCSASPGMSSTHLPTPADRTLYRYSVCERVQETENWFRISELELTCSLLQSVRTSSVEHPVVA